MIVNNMKTKTSTRHLATLAVVLATTFPLAGQAHDDNMIFSTTRIEVDAGRFDSQSSQTWRADGWIGHDYNRFAWRTQGARTGGKTDEADVQALYSRYLASFWDIQAGLRHEFKPDGKDYGVIALRGLAPYAFDVDTAAFVRTDGKLFACTRFEYDLLMTNRFIVRPFIAADWSLQSLPDEGIKSGRTSSEVGVNFRYEIKRSFAPYVEVSHQTHAGLAEKESGMAVRAGLRLVF